MTLDLNDLIRFEPNTLAKAQEVDHNFQLLKSILSEIISSVSGIETNIVNLLNNKANITGDPTISFYVGNPTESRHAVNKSTLESYLGNFIYYIYGLDIVRDTNSTNTIIVTAGECYDSTKQHKLVLGSDTSFENSNQQASHTYDMYLFGNNTEGNVTVIFSEQGTTPANPTGYLYSRIIGSYVTNSSNEISAITPYSNTSQSVSKSFVTLNETLPANTNHRIISIPDDGNVYLIWVYNGLDATGVDMTTTIQTDIFPRTTFNCLDNDANRRSQSKSMVCIPMSSSGYIRSNRSCSIRGYMRV